MEVVASILLDIFFIYAVAVIADELMERIHQPPVIGELLAGVLIGPYALGLLGMPSAGLAELFHSETAAREALNIVYSVLAELGLVILLFFVGLDTRLSSLLRVGGRSAITAVAGIILPFVLGHGFLLVLGLPSIEAFFLGTAMIATSVGITARVLADLGYLRTVEARIIIGAAVLDDILGMILLAIVSGLASPSGVSALGIILLAAEATAFTGFVLLVGTHVIRRFSIHLERLHIQHAPYVVAILVTLGLATLSSFIGLAAVIGAFMAGMVFAESHEKAELERQATSVYALLVPFFFVITGSHVDWRIFLDTSLVGVALAITGLAVVGKLFGCGLGAWGMSLRSMLIVGVGMVPRGEVGLIVASIGLAANVISSEMFSIAVIVSVLTTLIAPPVLSALYGARGFATAKQAEERQELAVEREECGEEERHFPPRL